MKTANIGTRVKKDVALLLSWDGTVIEIDDEDIAKIDKLPIEHYAKLVRDTKKWIADARSTAKAMERSLEKIGEQVGESLEKID